MELYLALFVVSNEVQVLRRLHPYSSGSYPRSLASWIQVSSVGP